MQRAQAAAEQAGRQQAAGRQAAAAPPSAFHYTFDSYYSVSLSFTLFYSATLLLLLLFYVGLLYARFPPALSPTQHHLPSNLLLFFQRFVLNQDTILSNSFRQSFIRQPNSPAPPSPPPQLNHPRGGVTKIMERFARTEPIFRPVSAVTFRIRSGENADTGGWLF
ncbi:hypothetical protein SDJN03_11975, partial [Cucurbita argyrosperma subsp. sororia]